MVLKPVRNPKKNWAFGVLLALFIVHFLVRWVVAHSPLFVESYYDEAVTGNMALHILRGESQLFFWGQPYMGALEAYLTSSLFFLLGPSAFTLHLNDILICAFLLFMAFRIGTLAGGRPVGLLAAAFWAFSPLYLSVIGLLATGGHEEACAAGAFILFGICRLSFSLPPAPVPLAGLIGLLGGLGFWSSLLSGPYLLAGGLGPALARPRLLLTRVPWVGLAGFLVGSFPFWLWEIRHDFSTFQFFESQGVGIFSQLPVRIYTVLRYSFFQSLLGDWWDGHSVLPAVPPILAWAVWAIFYLPAFVLSLMVILRWGRRIVSFRGPFQEPIDLVVAVFWVLVLGFSTSEQGATGSLRYTLTFYIPFSVLTAVWLSRMLTTQRWVGGGLLIFLLAFNLFLHALFLKEYQDLPYRPIAGLINALEAHHIRFAYADNRIAQPLTFESQEKIICADYSGQRNYDYLRAVDQAPAGEVAIITHRELGNPPPELMGASLELIGGSSDHFEQGNYVVWYNFKEPALYLRPVSAKEWRITASRNAENAALIKDRDILSGWEIPERPGEWVQVDLGRVLNLNRVSLLPGPGIYRESGFLRLEISKDGKTWEALIRDQQFLAGLSWVGGRPRLDDNPRIQISFPPREGRFLRITNLLQPEIPNKTWAIAELFVYESLEQPDPPNPQTEEPLVRARQALDHWTDDPTGPHPLFPGTNTTFRKRQVHWAEVIRDTQTAISLAPNWEDPHQLFGKALDLGGMETPIVQEEEKKGLNYKDLFSQGELIRRIPRDQFKVVSNFNDKAAELAIDGDPFTRWGTLREQSPGMFFQVDLGERYEVKGFSLFLNNSIYDYPRSLKILGSTDGTNWRDIQATSLAEYALRNSRLIKQTTYRFDPLPIRYLKLIQIGSDPRFWWSIYELEVLGARTVE
jgi:F5/8 type C domain